MDNRGIPARVNSRVSQIGRYAEYRRIQDPSEGWPFDTPVMYEALQVPLSNRRGKQVVEAAEPSSRRVNTETKNAADENNRETPIANVGDAGNASAPNPANVSQGPNEGDQVEDRNGKRVASGFEADSLLDSEDDAEHPRQLNVAPWEPLKTKNGEAPESSTRRDAENVVNLGAEYDRELEVAIQESLRTPDLQREHDILPEGVTRPESEAAEGKIISNIEPTESMPHPPVSSRGRPLKPTVKLLELPNTTIAPSPSKRKRKDGASTDRQIKQKAVKPVPAVPRFNESDTTLNHRPRGLLRRQGVTDVSEPGSVVGQASLANGMDRPTDVVNTNGSGAGVEVRVSEPSGSGSLGGQAREVNEVGCQTDMSAALPEAMVCVTNRNPMDLPVEEAMEYMRSENRVTPTQKVKLFGAYIA